MAAHRPALYLVVKSVLDNSHVIMGREIVAAYYVPSEDGVDTLRIPNSCSATIRQPPPVRRLDEVIRDVVIAQGQYHYLGISDGALSGRRCRTLRGDERENTGTNDE